MLRFLCWFAPRPPVLLLLLLYKTLSLGSFQNGKRPRPQQLQEPVSEQNRRFVLCGGLCKKKKKKNLFLFLIFQPQHNPTMGALLWVRDWCFFFFSIQTGDWLPRSGYMDNSRSETGRIRKKKKLFGFLFFFFISFLFWGSWEEANFMSDTIRSSPFIYVTLWWRR